MSNAEAKLFAVCPTKRESFDVSEVCEEAGHALVAWALEENVESPAEVTALLSRGHINVYGVRKMARSDSYGDDAAEAAIESFLGTWQQVYGADADDEPPCAPGAYRRCTAEIEEALRTFADGLEVKRYEAVSCETLASEQIIKILWSAGVFK